MRLSRALIACLCLALAAGLGGCAGARHSRPSASSSPSASSTVAGGADTAAAGTILVPPDTNALATTVEDVLTRRGWHLLGYAAGQTTASTDYAAMARRARYRLTLRAKPIGDCHAGVPGYHYRLALIDNASGQVPVALAGTDCLDALRAALSAALTRAHVQPARSS